MALIDKASLLMVPSTYEAGTLYNVLPSGNRAPDSTDQNSGYDQTRADFTFDRGSNAAATRVNSDGLIEKYRENFLTYSNNLNGSDWAATRLFSQTNGHSGYDGSNDAWLIIPNSSNNTHYLNQVITSGNGVQTISVYAKAGGYDYFSIRDGSASDTYGLFDLATQTTSTDGSNAIESKMVSVGNDWYRCSLTLNRTAGGSNNLLFYVNNVYSNKPAYVGDEVSGVYFQDFQLESGMVSTDYLDSTSVTAKAGVLIDLPRINYDANGENGALLLEPSRANLVQFSEYFGGWNKSTGAITITQNYGISPEGVKNSSRIQFTSSNQHISISTSLGVGVVSTGSVYIKGTNGETIEFDTGGAGSLKTLNGDWQRIEVTSTSVSSLLLINTFGGATARDIEVWGAQCEQASYATSYIPNHSGTGGVTRAADSCSVTGVSDVIGQTEGTIYAEFFMPNDYTENEVHRISLSDGSLDNWVFMSIPEVGDETRMYLRIGASTKVDTQTTNSPFTHNQINKIAYGYKSGDLKIYINGEAFLSSSLTYGAFTLPLSRINITGGSGGSSSPQDVSNTLKNIAIFKTRLTNEELATLTTL